MLISLLECGVPSVERGAAIILGAAVKNEQYKSRIVSLGGYTFLSRLMQLVKEHKIEVQRSVDPGEIQLLEKVGEGVSGVVSKCIFQGQVCAVKKFNEENIAFDEEEFDSELAIMRFFIFIFYVYFFLFFIFIFFIILFLFIIYLFIYFLYFLLLLIFFFFIFLFFKFSYFSYFYLFYFVSFQTVF